MSNVLYKFTLFYAKRTQFPKSQMNISNYKIMEYEQMDTWSCGTKQSQTKPIQTQFKANTNPIQSQFKPKQSQFYLPIRRYSEGRETEHRCRIPEITSLWRLKSMAISGNIPPVNRVRVPLTKISNLKCQIGEI
jgi:hypothetical protein